MINPAKIVKRMVLSSTLTVVLDAAETSHAGRPYGRPSA